MQSVGEKLRKARLEKNLSLDEVYKQTRVHSGVLQALEEDRSHNFLSFIYIKGFLKTYARYLGLDAEKLLKEYVDSQKVETHPQEVPLEKKRKIIPQLKPFLIVRIVLTLIFFVAFIFYFRFVLWRISTPTEETKRQKVKVTVLPASQVKVEDLVLEVKTLDTCWMRVKADNRVIFQSTLLKGRRERWQAKEKIELRIGKPEALEVFLNGKPVDLKRLQVKRSLVITQKGIEGK